MGGNAFLAMFDTLRFTTAEGIATSIAMQEGCAPSKTASPASAPSTGATLRETD